MSLQIIFYGPGIWIQMKMYQMKNGQKPALVKTQSVNTHSILLHINGSVDSTLLLSSCTNLAPIFPTRALNVASRRGHCSIAGGAVNRLHAFGEKY
jgi:hypothetical protein